jgi:hypothetical protein
VDDDEWWATLPAERKRSIRRWLDPDDPEHARREAMEHPDQLALPLEAQRG